MSILQNNKKATAGIGVVAAAAAVLALGAGTYAAFTDTENAQATFAAGTLDLTIGGTGEAGQITFENLAPGQTIEHQVSVGNAGTVNGVLSFSATFTETDVECVEPEQEVDGCGADLANAITVGVAGHKVPLSQLQGISMGDIPLAAQSEESYTLTFTVDPLAGNEIMADSVVVDIAATLDQAPTGQD